MRFFGWLCRFVSQTLGGIHLAGVILPNLLTSVELLSTSTHLSYLEWKHITRNPELVSSRLTIFRVRTQNQMTTRAYDLKYSWNLRASTDLFESGSISVFQRAKPQATCLKVVWQLDASEWSNTLCSNMMAELQASTTLAWLLPIFSQASALYKVTWFHSKKESYGLIIPRFGTPSKVTLDDPLVFCKRLTDA